MPQKRVPKIIPGYAKSYALLSGAGAVDTAVLFVHGFGGKPTSTWRNFQGLVDTYPNDYPWGATLDLFFYAYESLHTQIRFNANLLGNFTDDVWHGTWERKGSPEAKQKYKDLILVGHSEGGVIIRRLILDRYAAVKVSVENANPGSEPSALRDTIKSALDSDYLLASYLRLFAPACRGTNFSSWAGFLTSFSHLVSAIASSSLVKNELLPGSSVLDTLKTGTELAHREFREVRSLFTEPIFGVPDQIVTSDSYQDEKLHWDKGYDHFTVCKPDYIHTRPLEFIRK